MTSIRIMLPVAHMAPSTSVSGGRVRSEWTAKDRGCVKTQFRSRQIECSATCATTRDGVQTGGLLKADVLCSPNSKPEKIVLRFRFGQAFSHSLDRERTTIATCPAALVWRTPPALAADQRATVPDVQSAQLCGHWAMLR
jgi:hypothetical protein